jgi:hypothetical protein
MDLISEFVYAQSVWILGYGLGWGSIPSRGNVGIFPFAAMPRLAMGSAKPPIQWVLGVKQPACEADHSPLVLRLRMNETVPPLLPHIFMGWCLIK